MLKRIFQASGEPAAGHNGLLKAGGSRAGSLNPVAAPRRYVFNADRLLLIQRGISRLVYGGGLTLCPRSLLCFLGPPVALLTSCRLPLRGCLSANRRFS